MGYYFSDVPQQGYIPDFHESKKITLEGHILNKFLT